MNKVDRFWSHEANNIRCVRESDYDRDTQALREGAKDSDAGLVLYMEKSAELAADNQRLREALIAAGKAIHQLQAEVPMSNRIFAQATKARCAANKAAIASKEVQARLSDSDLVDLLVERRQFDGPAKSLIGHERGWAIRVDAAISSWRAKHGQEGAQALSLEWKGGGQ